MEVVVEMEWIVAVWFDTQETIDKGDRVRLTERPAIPRYC